MRTASAALVMLRVPPFALAAMVRSSLRAMVFTAVTLTVPLTIQTVSSPMVTTPSAAVMSAGASMTLPIVMTPKLISISWAVPMTFLSAS